MPDCQCFRAPQIIVTHDRHLALQLRELLPLLLRDRSVVLRERDLVFWPNDPRELFDLVRQQRRS